MFRRITKFALISGLVFSTAFSSHLPLYAEENNTEGVQEEVLEESETETAESGTPEESSEDSSAESTPQEAAALSV